jgi:hypothetical protein
MFEIEKINHFGFCQVCNSKNILDSFYTIKVMNKDKQGTELHLCGNCCNVLSKLTAEPDKRMYGIRVMSIDELEG